MSGGFIVSAVAAGVLLAAQHGHLLATAHAVTTASGTSMPVSGNVALGQQLASAYGWGSGAEWTCLDELWTRESGWRMVWNYRGLGAYGIPQALPASKMASAGADYMTNPATEIRWGLGYVANTPYGTHTPCGAWAHEQTDGWY